MDNAKRPILLIILGVAIVITIAWQVVAGRRSDNSDSANNTSSTVTPPIANITNVDPIDFDSIIQEELSLADIKSSSVNPRSKLAAVVVELPASLVPRSGTTRYVYSADDDKANNWMITFNQSDSRYVRASIPKEDYLGELQQMNTKLWKFNYVTALKIAEENGGLAWRESNNLSDIKLTLQHLPPQNWLQWKIEYAGQGSTLTISVDANSGQVIE